MSPKELLKLFISPVPGDSGHTLPGGGGHCVLLTTV